MHEVSKYYEDDHDRLDELFREFQRLKQSDFYRAKEFFEQFKFGLQRHIAWEEDILFPLFERVTGINSGPTYVMKLEHQEITQHLEAIHEKVVAGDPDSDGEEKKLVAILGLHNQKEEQILYPAIDRVISSKDVEKVFEEMRSTPEHRYLVACSHAR